MVNRILKMILPDLTAKNQMELVDGGYKIQETEKYFDDEPNFAKNIQINHATIVSDSVTDLETVIVPETLQMLLLVINCIYELPNDLRHRILGNRKYQEKLKTSQNYCVVLSPHPEMKILSPLVKFSWKTEIELK